MEWLSENVDEVIALVLVVTFSVVSGYLAIIGKTSELQQFVQNWAPFLSAVVGFLPAYACILWHMRFIVPRPRSGFIGQWAEWSGEPLLPSSP